MRNFDDFAITPQNIETILQWKPVGSDKDIPFKPAQFLKWAQKSFNNFSVVPPGMGICYQVNLEYLSKVVVERNGEIFPDTLVGT